MSWEIITCPLSACFLGMSAPQAKAASTLACTDARGPVARAEAAAAYEALPSASETGDGRQPTFFQRMFRRVGQSPLSRGEAEASASELVETLLDTGVLTEAPRLTTASAEDFHGQFDPDAMRALRCVLADPTLDACSLEARLVRLTEAGGARAPRASAAQYANLALDGVAVLYLPAEVKRVVAGSPHDIGSSMGLRSEIARVRATFDLVAGRPRDATDPRFALGHTLDALEVAALAAEEHDRVLLLST